MRVSHNQVYLGPKIRTVLAVYTGVTLLGETTIFVPQLGVPFCGSLVRHRNPQEGLLYAQAENTSQLKELKLSKVERSAAFSWNRSWLEGLGSRVPGLNSLKAVI